MKYEVVTSGSVRVRTHQQLHLPLISFWITLTLSLTLWLAVLGADWLIDWLIMCVCVWEREGERLCVCVCMCVHHACVCVVMVTGYWCQGQNLSTASSPSHQFMNSIDLHCGQLFWALTDWWCVCVCVVGGGGVWLLITDVSNPSLPSTTSSPSHQFMNYTYSWHWVQSVQMVSSSSSRVSSKVQRRSSWQEAMPSSRWRRCRSTPRKARAAPTLMSPGPTVSDLHLQG